MIRAQIIRYGDIDKRFPERDPDSSRYKYRVLAEGDSWFTLGAVPSSNVLYHIRVSKPTALVSMAKPGDTIIRMGEPDRMSQLHRVLAVPQFAYKWDAILLSGGGNDLIDSGPDVVRRRGTPSDHPADYVDTAVLGRLLTAIQDAYASIVAMRDAASSPSRGKPIYVHTYDYATPRNSPARFLGAGIMGPWLYPACLLADIPQPMWQPVSDYLLDRLAEAILTLDSGSGSRPLPGVFVVDTRGTLSRARPGTISADADWSNEIHPNTTGYRKIGERLSARLKL